MVFIAKEWILVVKTNALSERISRKLIRNFLFSWHKSNFSYFYYIKIVYILEVGNSGEKVI